MRLGIHATAIFLLVAGAASAPADDVAARAESKRLSEAAIERHHVADDLEEGWAAVYDQGIELAERSLAADSRNPDAHYALFLNLGRKSERSGIAAQAANIGRLRTLLDRALEIDPNHGHALEARGEMLMRLPRLFGGSNAKGEQALLRSAELEPRWAKPPLRLAQYYWRTGDRDKALRFAKQARDLAREAGDQQDYLDEAETLLAEIASSRH